MQFVQYSRMRSSDECIAPPSFLYEHVFVEMLTEQQIISEVSQMPQIEDVYVEDQCSSSEFQNLCHKINIYINKESDLRQLIHCKFHMLTLTHLITSIM